MAKGVHEFLVEEEVVEDPSVVVSAYRNAPWLPREGGAVVVLQPWILRSVPFYEFAVPVLLTATFQDGSADPLFPDPSLKLPAGSTVGAQAPLLVAGHTDTTPIKEEWPWESNRELSLFRALKTLDALCLDLQELPSELGALGYGQYSPIASNSSDEGRSRNRRVTLVRVSY